jgi:hypothetical protein
MGKNERIRTIIGLEYIKKEWYPACDHMDVHVQDAFAEISRVNRELFNMIPYVVQFTSEDVYSSAKEMRERVQEEGIVYIYTGWSGHPILTQEDNNIGRAVHDVFAHLVCGCPFTFEGEYTAYLEQRKWYPQWTWDVLFAEIPAQTAAYYYVGSHNFDQRAIAAPKRWMELTKSLDLQDYSHNSILNPTKFLEVI